jgi:type IV secretory pathway TraG/TraD family ATPase VirD4
MFLTDLTNRVVEHARARPGDPAPRPCSLHLDGLVSTSGWIPDLPARLEALRTCVAVTASVDSLAQIATSYGPEADAVVASFRSTIYAAGCDAVDAQHASRCSGTTTAEEERHTRSERVVDMQVLIESTTSTHFVPRPLLVPTEVSHPPEHFALGRPFTLFLAGGLRPFQAWFPAARDAGLVASTGPLSTRRAG